MPIPVAEVGSALLQRHEAYVRRHEVRLTCLFHVTTLSRPEQPNIPALRKATQDSVPGHAETDQAGVDARVAGLLKENAVLEKVIFPSGFACNHPDKPCAAADASTFEQRGR